MRLTAVEEKQQPDVRELLEIEKKTKNQDEIKWMLQQNEPIPFQVHNSIVFHPFF